MTCTWTAIPKVQHESLEGVGRVLPLPLLLVCVLYNVIYVFKCFIVPVSAYRVPDNMKCMMHKPFSSLNISAPVFTCGYGNVFTSNALSKSILAVSL